MHFRQKTVRRFQIPIDERSTDEYRLLVADLGLPPSLDLTSPVLSAPTARMSIRLKVFLQPCITYFQDRWCWACALAGSAGA